MTILQILIQEIIQILLMWKMLSQEPLETGGDSKTIAEGGWTSRVKVAAGRQGM